MSRFNQASVTINGNLVSDPKNIAGEGKKPCYVFRIAVNRQRKNDQGVYERVATDFFECKSFEAVAATLTKGQPASVTGDLVTETATSKDGVEYTTVKVIARNVEPFVFPTKSASDAVPA